MIKIAFWQFGCGMAFKAKDKICFGYARTVIGYAYIGFAACFNCDINPSGFPLPVIAKGPVPNLPPRKLRRNRPF